MSDRDPVTGVTRRDALRLAFVGTAAAVAPSATAQDGGSTDGTTYEPPDQFIGDAQQAIGADRMLVGALKYDETDRTPDSFTDATLRFMTSYSLDDYYDDPSDLEEAAGNGILQIDQMDNASHHVLTNMFNEIQLATDKAWFDGMVAFLEAADDGEDQSTCVDAAKAAGVESQARIQENLLTWWKEQMNHLKALRAYLNESFDWSSHSSSLSDVLTAQVDNDGSSSYPLLYTGDAWTHYHEDLTLVDGSTISEVPGIEIPVMADNDNVVSYFQVHVHRGQPEGYPEAIPLVSLPDGSVTNGLLGYNASFPGSKAELVTAVEDNGYSGVGEAFATELGSNLRRSNMYSVMWDWLVQEADLIEANLDQWATNAYGELQAGTIDIAGIVQANPTLAASEFATEYSSTGRYSYAAASLASIGVAYDYEHEMHVELHDGTELEGTMFVSESDFSVEVGNTVDPSDVSEDGHVYFAYDAGSAQRELASGEYQEAIDGGVATLMTTPADGTVYVLTTIEDETVEIGHDQWEPVDEDAAVDPDATTDWTIDLSSDLDTPITSIESIVHQYPEGTGADLIRLMEPFTITEAYDVESGDSVDTVDGEQGTDLSETDVQFAEEDLEAFREMVAAVADDSDPGGGAAGGLGFGLPSLPSLSSGVGILLLAAAGGAAYLIGQDGGNNGRAR